MNPKHAEERKSMYLKTERNKYTKVNEVKN